MKKLMLFVFCAVLCAALTSCEKENDGKYSPKKKIQKVFVRICVLHPVVVALRVRQNCN